MNFWNFGLIFGFFYGDCLNIGAEFFVKPSPLEAGEHIVVSTSEACEGTGWSRCDFEKGLVDLIDERLILFLILEMEKVPDLFEVLLDINKLRDFLQYFRKLFLLI